MRPERDRPENYVGYERLHSSLQFCLILCAISLVFIRPYLIDFVRDGKCASEWLLVGPLLFLLLFLSFLAFEFFYKNKFSLFDLVQAFFGILIIALLFPSSLREYRTRQMPHPMSVQIIEKFYQHKDASIRALAILASSRHNISDPSLGALIHKGLLDKDPIVQEAAKLVIEDNFGIILKNGVEGILQAQSLLTDIASSALLMKKGLP
jgi:hypothetical protein